MLAANAGTREHNEGLRFERERERGAHRNFSICIAFIARVERERELASSGDSTYGLSEMINCNNYSCTNEMISRLVKVFLSVSNISFAYCKIGEDLIFFIDGFLCNSY